MFIQTEQTPNPATLKFLPGQDISPESRHDFTSANEAHNAPLAERLFSIDGVKSVFYGTDYLSVTKNNDVDWLLLKPLVLGAIMDHLISDHPIFTGAANEQTVSDHIDSAIVTQIKELLDTRIRPAVAQDGGDIVYHSYDNGIVYLAMRGACAGCPSATVTLKMGVENLLCKHIPEVKEVRPAPV